MSGVANFFDQIAETQTVAPVRRKLERAEKRQAAAKQAEQDQRDAEMLGRAFRAWKAAQRDALLSGPHGKEVRGIVSFLKTMQLSSAPALIRTIERSAWIHTMTVDERFRLLGIIGAGIAACREKNGLEPFDDEIPFAEPPKAFTQIKTLMGLQGR